MKHAACYSHQLEEHSGHLKFLIHPVSEWQYLALMNHAAKMYRAIKEIYRLKRGDVDLNKIIQSLVKEIVQIEVSGKK